MIFFDIRNWAFSFGNKNGSVPPFFSSHLEKRIALIVSIKRNQYHSLYCSCVLKLFNGGGSINGQASLDRRLLRFISPLHLSPFIGHFYARTRSYSKRLLEPNGRNTRSENLLKLLRFRRKRVRNYLLFFNDFSILSSLLRIVFNLSKLNSMKNIKLL